MVLWEFYVSALLFYFPWASSMLCLVSNDGKTHFWSQAERSTAVTFAETMYLRKRFFQVRCVFSPPCRHTVLFIFVLLGLCAVSTTAQRTKAESRIKEHSTAIRCADTSWGHRGGRGRKRKVAKMWSSRFNKSFHTSRFLCLTLPWKPGGGSANLTGMPDKHVVCCSTTGSLRERRGAMT